MDTVNVPQIGIVVPTLGTRSDFLNQALSSIRAAGECHIVIVAPKPEDIKKNYSEKLFDSVIEDPKSGLLSVASRVLDNSPSSVCVYGQCSYIGPTGNLLWINKSGNYAKWLMRIGPQLIPQPGSLFTLSAFTEAGGLNPNYKWAFDLDLLLRLSRIGSLLFIPETLSSFRWHEGSLSVGGRHGSVDEASKIRRGYLPKSLRGLSPIWEFFVRRLILGAGVVLSKKSRKKKELE